MDKYQLAKSIICSLQFFSERSLRAEWFCSSVTEHLLWPCAFQQHWLWGFQQCLKRCLWIPRINKSLGALYAWLDASPRAFKANFKGLIFFLTLCSEQVGALHSIADPTLVSWYIAVIILVKNRWDHVSENPAALWGSSFRFLNSHFWLSADIWIWILLVVPYTPAMLLHLVTTLKLGLPRSLKALSLPYNPYNPGHIHKITAHGLFLFRPWQ